MVRENDEVTLAEESKKLTTVKESLKEYTRSGVMPWLEVDPDRVWGKLRAKPQRNDVADLGHVKEQLIVELYSK
jgi:small subunit ribosomal protein S4